MQNRRNDNRGLTLIELLIAVLMLGVLISPLLHSFVVSASTAAKARSYNETTNAATNLIEQIKGSNLDFVLQDVVSNKFLFSVTANVVANKSDIANGKYVLALSNYSYNGRVYEGFLTLDASQYKQSLTTNNINEELVAKYSFTGLRAGAEMSHFEITAANDLTNKANVEAVNQHATIYAAAIAAATSGNAVTPPPAPPDFSAEQILGDGSLKRNLTVSVSMVGASGKEQLQVNARCNYSYSYNSGDYHIQVTADPLEQLYYGPYDPVLYFFYFPIYIGGEEIVIENPQDLPLTIFLVKQWPTAVASVIAGSNESERASWMSTQDAHYNTRANSFLTLYQSSRATAASPGAVIFSNLAVNIADGSAPMIQPNYRIISGNSAWGASKPLDSHLVELIQADRIYKMVLELAEVGNESNSVTIETTKLDFPDN